MRVAPVLLGVAASALLLSPAVVAQDDAGDPVTTAAYATVATGSIGFDLRILVEGRGSRIELDASGAVELQPNGRGWLDLDLSAAGLPPLETLIDGRFVYVRGGGLTDTLEDGTWLGLDLDSTDPATAELRETLSDTDDAPLILYWLLGGTEAPRYLGAQSLGVVPVDHYALQVDLDDATQAVPEDLRQLMKDTVYQLRDRGFEPMFDADVWIDDAGMVRRASYAFVYRPTNVDAFGFTWDLHDFGEPVDLALPDPANVVLLGDSQLPDPDPAVMA